MRTVVALGQNALLGRGEPIDAATQRRAIELAARSLAPLAAEHELVVTHGNGQQAGLPALQGDAFGEGGTHPLDVLGAEAGGMIGYLLQQELRNATGGREVATLLTQVVVDEDDDAFSHPTRFIGPVYGHARASALADGRGWTMRRDGDRWRRVIAAPEPLEIVELETIERLASAGVLVVCAGGGGVPVVRGDDGLLRGVEAVVDKDLAAAVLATALDADALMLLTDVPAEATEAAARFAAATGRRAVIGGLADASQLLHGERGTTIAAAGHAVEAGSP
jgi:carbamate kinase